MTTTLVRDLMQADVPICRQDTPLYLDVSFDNNLAE